jgi:thiosulfate/3-mercaptopyruvate sulfurtransferase
MKRTGVGLFLLLALVSCNRRHGFRHPELRVDVVWLRAHAGEPTVRIVDARPAQEYADGHLPGAVSLPVTETLDPTRAKNHPDQPQRLAALFAAHGIGNDQRVIVYDDGKQTPAARLFWTLEWAGHPSVAVLDGGIEAWKAAGGPVTRDVPPPTVARFEAHPRAERLADKAACAAAIGATDTLILDTRTAAEYRGDDKRAQAGGHIPGAVNVDWAQNFGEDGRLRDAGALRSLYASAGVTPEKQVFVHCQTGQRSSVTYWVLRLLGQPRVANYAGSWVEWGNDPALPKHAGLQP